MEKIAVYLSLEGWQSVLSSIGSEETYPSDGVEDTIRNALCPEGHTEEIQITIRTSSRNYKYIWAAANCSICYECLWSIWHQNVEKQTYRYHNYLEPNSKETIFEIGSKEDPKKFDMAKYLAEGVCEWRKI